MSLADFVTYVTYNKVCDTWRKVSVVDFSYLCP